MQDDKDIRNRVRVAVGLLVGAKVLNVGVPFLFKQAIDTLNGNGMLGVGSAPETVVTMATALLVGCKIHKIYKNELSF